MSFDLAEPQMGERQVGQYILEHKLGEGGMAEVWKGRHCVLGIPVAVKFLSANLAGIPDVEQRFLVEGKRQAHLAHPNIVAANDFLYLDGRSYLIMKYVEGESLDELLFRLQAPVPLPQFMAIATDVLRALEYAHSQNVVHRDIKPSNVLIEKTGRALVMDFGIALMLGEERKTRVGVAIGTPHYMSPEQITGSRSLDRRTDIYSLGCVLYQMATGRVPFEAEEGEGDTEYLIKEKHLRQPPVPPRQWNPYIPDQIEHVVLRCLEKNAANRFDSCQDVLLALTADGSSLRPFSAPKKETVLEQGSPTISEQGTPTVVLPLPPRQTLTPTPISQPPAQPLRQAVPVTAASQAVLSSPASPRVRRNAFVPWIATSACVLVALAAGGVYVYTQHQKLEPAPTPVIDHTTPPQANPTDGRVPEPVPPRPVVISKSTSHPSDESKAPENQPPMERKDPPVQSKDDKHGTPASPEAPTTTTPVSQTQTPVTTPEDKGSAPVSVPVQPVPSRPPVIVEPTPRVSRPPHRSANEGNLIWSGEIAKNQVIQISGGTATIGKISGDPFPGDGVPIQVSINNGNFAVTAQPNPLNRFSQVALRSTMKGNVTVIIHWKVLSSE